MSALARRTPGAAIFFTLPGIALATLAVSTASAEQAQGAKDEFAIEEIIVTATKREARLQDVPVAVSAITAEDIAARGYTQYADYLNSVPGVYFEDAGPGRSQVRIRGLSSVESGVPSTVASYFGETVTSVLSGQGGKPNLRLVDIDRVEVLRGPQGTLFGANALAGVVRTIPTAPKLDRFEASVGARLSTTAHSDDASYHVNAALNLPLIDDRLALRVVGYKDDLAGYIDNVFPGQTATNWTQTGGLMLALLSGLPPGSVDLPDGTLSIPAIPAMNRKDINAEDTWGARTSLAWQPTDRLRFDLMYATQQSTLDSEPHTTPTAGAYRQSRGADFFERGLYEEKIDITSLTGRYDWDSMQLFANSSWVRFERRSLADYSQFASNLIAGISGAAVPLPWTLHSDSDSKQFTQEIRLQSTGNAALNWILGVFYLEQESNFSQTLFDQSCPTCLPGLLTGDNFALRVIGTDFFSEKQRAIFGEVTYDLSPQWSVGVSARYFDGEIVNVTPAFAGFLGGGVSGEVTRQSGEEFNPAAHVRFRPTENVTLYLQAARGFRTGQANPPLPTNCAAEAEQLGFGELTDADTLWNYELGAKTVLADGRVNLNAAIYHADWKGVQLSSAFQCGFSGYINGGDATARGVEVELAAQLARHWRLNLTAAYNRNEFDKVVPQTGFVKGERLPGSAEKNMSAGLQYDFSLGTQWSGFTRADYVYTGDVLLKFGAGANTTPVTQDAYGVGNLRLALQRDNLSIELFGRNITDERGIASTSVPAVGSNQIIIRPREIGIEARYSF